MKKMLLIGGGLIVLLLAGLIVTVILSINPIIEKAVNTFGPQITGTKLTLGSANVSFLSGEGRLSRLFVGNPEGFSSPSAIEVGDISVAVDKNSLTTDRIVIKRVVIDSPIITYETKGKTNNIQALANNVQKKAASGGDSKASSGQQDGAQSSKKLVIEELIIRNGQINLAVPGLEGKSLSVPLSEIRLTGIGEKKDASPEDVFAVVLRTLNADVATAATAGIRNLGGMVGEGVKGVGDSVGQGAKSVGDKIKGIFE